MRIRQSFCLPMFDPGAAGIDALFTAAKRIGYEAVEIWDRDESFEEIARRAKSAGLVIASMCGHRSATDGLNRRENHERIDAELRASIELAARHGIPGVICFSGSRQAGQPPEDAIETAAEALRAVAPFAEKHRVNINLELLNSKVNHPGYDADSTAWAVKLCQRTGSPRIKILYDIYHMQIMEGDVIRTIRDNIRYIGHFHTAGNPGRNDFDDEQELNYRGICRAIAGTGYGGFVGHEFKPRGDLAEALQTAFGICDQGAW